MIFPRRSAEAYLAKWRRWIRYSDWPCLPVCTFPFLPLPLPTKWHIHFLPAIHLDQRYGPEAAQNPAIVRQISADVRCQMQEAMSAIVSRRESLFWGSVF